MTRIIQRCLLVLAFTGVLLSTAQENTVSDLSETTISSEQASPSTVESSSYSTQNFSFAPVVKSENESSSQSDQVVISTPGVSNFSSVNNGNTSDRANSGDETTADEFTKSTWSYTTEDIGTEYREGSTRLYTSSLSHSDGLFKAEIQDSESRESDKKQTFEVTTKTSRQSLSVDSAENTTYSYVQNGSDYGLPENETVSEKKSLTTSELPEVTTTTEVSKSAKAKSENATYDSSQNSVPSAEELIYNSSYVDNNQMSKNTYSTTPSKVQTEGKEENDLKSATRKRSLNATNAATSSGQTISTSALTPSLTHSQLSTEITVQPDDNAYDRVSVMNDANAVASLTSVPPNNDHGENNDEIITTESSSQAEIMTSSNIAVQNFQDSNREIESEQMVPKTSASSLDVTQMSASSSAALSTLSGESIHSSVSVGNMDQISHTVPELSTTLKSSEKEIETEGGPSPSSSSDLEYAGPLVTFDPNGMTNNFTQDPDSVTFSPNSFHVDGMPTDDYLSRLETNDSVNNTSISHEPIMYAEKMAHSSENLEGKLGELEVPNSSEREKEFILSSQNFAPHDEPYKEEMSDKEVFSSTKHPVDYKHSTGITQTSSGQNNKFFLYPLNDESEEMLNDAPQFVHSKFTVAPSTEVKYEEVTNILKTDSEVNVSNAISYTTGSSPKSTPEAANELDISVVYQTDQSVIRPITVTSPSQTSESIILLPAVLKVEPHPVSEATKAEQPDISSPIILPNPAPTVLNQSLEATTVVLQPDVMPEVNMAKTESNITDQTTNSSIAGVAVKTSVSVSIPLSKVSNESLSSSGDHSKNTGNEPFEAVSPLIDPLNKGTNASPSLTLSTEVPSVSSTDSSGPLIQKPKIKVPGRSDAPRTRKPYVPPHQRQTTTSGPPVAIFNRSRQRISSITSSTTARPVREFSTIRIHYASRVPPGMVPGGELVFSVEPIKTTTVPTTTETEEPFSDVPFTEQTQVPIVTNEDDVTLIKVAGFIVVDKGLRWTEQLDNRHSPQYKEKANFVHLQLERLFRTSSVAPHLWKIQIDGFSGDRNPRSVGVDFFLYLIKSEKEIPSDSLVTVFHEKLKNNTFSRFRVDPSKTSFEFVTEEPLKAPTPPPEKEPEPMIPQWAIAVIVVGAASLIFIILFAAVTILGRHHVRRRYSKKLNDEDSDRPGDWESKMAAAYENLAADTIYDAEDLHSDTYKKSCNSTYHGRPSRTSGPRRADSWSSSDWSPPPRRPRPQVHRIVY